MKKECMKKEYAKVELRAKNTPAGSYAAGCPPEYSRGGPPNEYYCRVCEVAA